MQKEIFKDVPGYEGIYQVSNMGNVKSLKFGKEKMLKPTKDTTGRLQVDFHLNKVRKNFKVHQLVAIVFLGHVPCGYKLVVDHINDNHLDNRVENLQIVTQRENACKTQGRYSSQYKGVNWRADCNKWAAKIKINNKSIHLGHFKNEYDAHLAYQNKLKEINETY